MGTPSTKTVRDIVLPQEKKVLTREEKIDLLESRRAILKPFLKWMPLEELDERSWTTPRANNWWMLKDFYGRWAIDSKRDPLKIKGFFFTLGISKPGKQILAGLDRKGDWVWVELTVEFTYGEVKVTGWRLVHPVQTDELVNLLKENYTIFWIQLADSVKIWVNDRRKKLNDAERVRDQIAKEDSLLYALVSRD